MKVKNIYLTGTIVEKYSFFIGRKSAVNSLQLASSHEAGNLYAEMVIGGITAR